MSSRLIDVPTLSGVIRRVLGSTADESRQLCAQLENRTDDACFFRDLVKALDEQRQTVAKLSLSLSGAEAQNGKNDDKADAERLALAGDVLAVYAVHMLAHLDGGVRSHVA